MLRMDSARIIARSTSASVGRWKKGKCCAEMDERCSPPLTEPRNRGRSPAAQEQLSILPHATAVSVIKTTRKGRTKFRRKKVSTRSEVDIASDTSENEDCCTRKTARHHETAGNSRHRQTDCACSRLSGTEPAKLPPFLTIYSEIMYERESALRDAAAAVSAALDSAYGNQIELWSQFLVSAVEYGEIPCQPQSTPERMLEISCEALQDGMLRLTRFASLLPGFRQLPAGDQQVLVSEKYLVHWLVHHARFIYKGEFYYLAGKENVHCSRYWLAAFEPDYLAYIVHFASSLNSIGLDLTETYILLAVALFRPDNTTASDTALLVRLHTYYLDTLLYVLGRRLSVTDGALAYHKLDCLFRHLPVVQKLSTDYVRTLQMDQFPIRSASTSCRQVLMDSGRILH